MNKYSKAILGAVTALIAVAIFPTITSAVSESMSDRLEGYTLLSVEERGELWYVQPESKARVYLGTTNKTWEVIKEQMIGITDADLARIPNSPELKERLMGRFLIAVEAHGEVYYLRPEDKKLYHLGTGANTFETLRHLAVGITKTDLNQITIDTDSTLTPNIVPDPIPVLAPAPAPEPVTPVTPTEPLLTLPVEYIDAQMGWNFASGIWGGYQEFKAANGHYPEIKWFESLIGYDLPIYFQENGFQLEAGQNNYFVWEQVTPEFKEMYRTAFTFETDGQKAEMSITVPGVIVSDQFGYLPAGTYHFSNVKGREFLTHAEYLNGTLKTDLSADAETKRIIDEVKRIQEGLDEYFITARGWYPMTDSEGIVLGEKGAVNLFFGKGFYGPAGNQRGYTPDIQSGAPTTELRYVWAQFGKTYTITFDVYGNYEEFTPGKYVANEFGLSKISDL